MSYYLSPLVWSHKFSSRDEKSFEKIFRAMVHKWRENCLYVLISSRVLNKSHHVKGMKNCHPPLLRRRRAVSKSVDFSLESKKFLIIINIVLTAFIGFQLVTRRCGKRTRIHFKHDKMKIIADLVMLQNVYMRKRHIFITETCGNNYSSDLSWTIEERYVNRMIKKKSQSW